MKLKALIIDNFRSFKNRTIITFDDFTTLIGKNDIGKSTILEALEIFFNNETVKIDSNDPCVFNEGNYNVVIGCVFTNLPDKIIIDDSAETNLKDEFLLNKDGDLEIIKKYKCTPNAKTIKPDIYVNALYPKNFKDPLLLFKQQQLKKFAQELQLPKESVKLNSNVSIRKAIYDFIDKEEGLTFELREIQLNKEDAKKIWDKLQEYLPIYALFQADRPSTDNDSEVQDPMNIAVKQALTKMQPKLDEIAEKVRQEALKTANNTLKKLKEMDENLANELKPEFAKEPNWTSLFKLTLNNENGIPVNKRGSGVRRLILLNFFRAEAERKQESEKEKGIIYGIEEPETSQHPNNQKLLIEALKTISNNDKQVIITTHVPGIAELCPTSSIRYITQERKKFCLIDKPSDDELFEIADALGVLPDKRVKLLICVEGKNDVKFLNHISRILFYAGKITIDLNNNKFIAILPLGGKNSLKEFIQRRYLKNFDIPELHILDRDYNNDITKLQNELNKRNDGSIIIRTERREMENYIHKDAIIEYFTKRFKDLPVDAFNEINFDDPQCDIPGSIKKLLDRNKIYLGTTDPPKENVIKDWLNNRVLPRMNFEQLEEMGVVDEILGWFKEIEIRVNKEYVRS